VCVCVCVWNGWREEVEWKCRCGL
jgi:hypothetical protein